MKIKEGIVLLFSSASRIYLWGCGFFIIGIASGLIFAVNRAHCVRVSYCLLLFFLFLVLLSKSMYWRVTIIWMFILVLGFGRSVLALPVYDSKHITVLADKAERVVGTVKEVAVATGRVMYVVAPDKYSGNFILSAPLYPRYNYGDRLEVSCHFMLPDDSGYRRYLYVRDIFITCGYARLNQIGVRSGNFFAKILFDWRQALNTKISSLWPEPRAALMAGILYGARGGMPQSLKDSFSGSGLSHIIAVSGYNTSIIATVLSTFFILIGFWRRQAFWLSVVGLLLFTVFTGASASVARAAVMSIFVMLGGYWGRPTRILNSLCTAGALMLLFNPRVLFDVGFQLSFVATIGVALVGPILQRYFLRSNDSASGFKKIVGDLFFTTLGALVVTLPLTIFYFGKMPALALLANILVVGFIPLIMLVGFAALVVSFFVWPLGLLFAFAADVGLRYIIWVSEILSVGNINVRVSFLSVLFFYFVIIWCLKRLSQYGNKK